MIDPIKDLKVEVQHELQIWILRSVAKFVISLLVQLDTGKNSVGYSTALANLGDD